MMMTPPAVSLQSNFHISTRTMLQVPPSAPLCHFWPLQLIRWTITVFTVDAQKNALQWWPPTLLSIWWWYKVVFVASHWYFLQCAFGNTVGSTEVSVRTQCLRGQWCFFLLLLRFPQLQLGEIWNLVAPPPALRSLDRKTADFLIVNFSNRPFKMFFLCKSSQKWNRSNSTLS